MANEKRLIDKKSAWKTAQRIYSDPVLLHAIKNTLDTTPTVDAVEVVHGEWQKVIEPLGWRDVDCAECSNCHESFVLGGDSDFDDLYLWKYCPNCGAKMDGDGNG